MPQHRNAVSNLPRVLFFVLLLSLLLSNLCLESVGELQEHAEGSNDPLHDTAATAALHLGTLSADSGPLISPKAFAGEATNANTAAVLKPRLAARRFQPESPPVLTTTAASTLRSPTTAKSPVGAADGFTRPRFAVNSSLSVATSAHVTAAHTESLDAANAAAVRSLAPELRLTRAPRTLAETASAHQPAVGAEPQTQRTTETPVALPAETAAETPRPTLVKPLGIVPSLPQGTTAQLSATAAEERRSPPVEPVEAELLRRATTSVTLGFATPDGSTPVRPRPDEDRPVLEPNTTGSAVETREHLKRALCRKYYKFVLGVHSSYNIDTLDCEYRPEPSSYIAEKVKEIKVQKDAAQARLDRIEAIKKLQRDAEANPTDRIIVEWDTACLKQLPTLMQDYVTEESDAEIPLFEADELQDSSEQVILKRGVYLRDRIGSKEKADPEVRQVLKGREYALGVIASSLRHHVSRKTIATGAPAASAAAAAGKPSTGVDTTGSDATGLPPCESECKRALQGVMLDAEIPTIQAAHYSKLGVDVLHIKNLKRKKKEWNIVRASEIPALITRLAREASFPPSEYAPFIAASSAASATSATESFTTATQRRNRDVERAELVVNCILKVSDDQKREVQSFRSPSTPPVADMAASGDPEQPRQWHLHSFLGNYTLWADRAWPELAGKPGNPVADNMIVAVLDTGCFIHQDFIDGFDIEKSRFWVNKEETDCENHIDDDGNGYVDDCFGWDFVGDQAYPFVDDLGHGTSVTSVLGARHGDALGGRGILATGKIMCLRVGGRAGIWLSDTIPALDYALRMGAKVSNHSYGGKGFDQAEFSAFRRASQADHLAVTAAGNSGCDIDKDESCLFTPGAFDLDGILNVGANDVAGYRTSFSNYGKEGVDVFAPGKSIFVGTNKAPNNGGKTCKHCYEFIDGTSFAAPMVSGIAAALWTHFEITQPIGWVASTKKKSLRVKEAIMYSVTGSRGVAGAGRVNGVVNFYKALHYYDTIPPAYTPEFPDPPNGYQPQGSFSFRSCSPTFLLVLLVLAVSVYPSCGA